MKKYILLLPLMFLSLLLLCTTTIRGQISEKTNELLSLFWETGDTLYIVNAIELNKTTGNLSDLAESYRIFGRYYDDQPQSLIYYQKAKDLFRQANDSVGLLKVHTNLGFYHYYLTNIEESLEEFYMALSFSNPKDDQFFRALIFGNIGSAYERLDDYLDSSRHYHILALELYQEIGDAFGIMTTYNNLGVLHQRNLAYDDALFYFTQAKELAIQNQELLEYCRTVNNIANVNNQKKNYQVALDLLLDSEESCGKIDLILNAYRFRTYHEAYSGLSLFEEALESYKSFHLTQDSIWNNELLLATKEITERYENEKKAQQIEKLELDQKLNEEKIYRRNLLTSGLVLLLVLFAAGGVIVTKQRNRISKEKKINEDLLLNILPASVAEELKSQGYCTVKQFDFATIMFTDFVGFTKIAETIEPEKLVAELNYCFSEFDRIVERNGLEKIKTIGDAYLAVSGLPNPRIDHAEVVCRTAVEILNFVKNRKENGGLFEIRIGIHSGPLVAGIVGLKKYAYDIWGDTVNTASRMEQESETGKINISQFTYMLVKPYFNFTYRGKITAKNKGEMDMYFLDSTSTDGI